MRLSRCGQALAAAVILAATCSSGALAASYEFVPAPQTDLNRIYRVDKYTGEVSSCQYGLQEGTVGVTLCFGSGDGAGPQPLASSASSPHGTSGRAGCSG